MKKVIFIGTALLLVGLLLSGCTGGVSQADYDAVVAERDAAQAEAASLQADIDAAEADLAALQADYDDLADDLAAALARIDELEGNTPPTGEHAWDGFVVPEDWTTYTDEENGFSISYPGNWIKKSATGDKKYAANAPAGMPGIGVYIVETDFPLNDYLLNVLVPSMGLSKVKILEDGASALGDGTPAEWAHMTSELSGIGFDSFALGVALDDGTLLVVFVTTAEGWGDPYDEEYFGGIAHTLELQ